MAAPCPTCGFTLWIPLGRLRVSEVGLYDDARFPGRLIVALVDHHEHLDELPAELLQRFVDDMTLAGKLLRDIAQSTRINYAVLGNVEPHVHAHVIPRGVGDDPDPDKAPWQSTAVRRPLPKSHRDRLVEALTGAIARDAM